MIKWHQLPQWGGIALIVMGGILYEDAAISNLEAMAEKLKPHGYEYFVIDNGWFGEYTLQEGAIYPAENMLMISN